MSRECGSVTIWGVGLLVVVFGFAGLAIDTWRVFAERQTLAGLADSAAIAGANAIDLDAFRNDAVVVLDQSEARRRAAGYLATRPEVRGGQVDVTIAFPDGGVAVTLRQEVELTLLAYFLGGESIPMTTTAYARPGTRTAP